MSYFFYSVVLALNEDCFGACVKGENTVFVSYVSDLFEGSYFIVLMWALEGKRGKIPVTFLLA